MRLLSHSAPSVFTKFFPNNKTALLFEPIKKLRTDIDSNLKSICDYELFSVGLSDEKGLKNLNYEESNTTLAATNWANKNKIDLVNT